MTEVNYIFRVVDSFALAIESQSLNNERYRDIFDALRKLGVTLVYLLDRGNKFILFDFHYGDLVFSETSETYFYSLAPENACKDDYSYIKSLKKLPFVASAEWVPYNKINPDGIISIKLRAGMTRGGSVRQ